MYHVQRPRLSREENQRRCAAIIEEAQRPEYHRYVGDELVKAYLAGEIDEIEGTAWNRPFGYCQGEGA